MLTKAFEWNGARFVVRPMSGMEKDFYVSILADVADAICKARGYDLDSLPRTLDKLIVMFVRWMLVTTIEGDALPTCNLMLDNPVPCFDAWVKAVTSNQELWTLWKQAYEDANRQDTSPLELSPAPQAESA